MSFTSWVCREAKVFAYLNQRILPLAFFVEMQQAVQSSLV
jgi:hypothetical protein